MKTPKNIAASVRQRLLNRSREENRPLNELLQYYRMERFMKPIIRGKPSGINWLPAGPWFFLTTD
jgi:hypothetical protein